jgi:hypothetical protein
MSENYHAIYSELDAMAKAFCSESDEFGRLRPRLKPSPADSGDATLNKGIEQTPNPAGVPVAAVPGTTNPSHRTRRSRSVKAWTTAPRRVSSSPAAAPAPRPTRPACPPMAATAGGPACATQRPPGA